MKTNRTTGMLFIIFIAVVAGIVIVLVWRQSVTPESEPTANENVISVSGVGGGEIDLENGALVNGPETANQNVGEQAATSYHQAGIWVRNMPQAEETISGEITTVDFGGNNSLSILSKDLEGIVRHSVGVRAETEVEIGGVTGTQIEGASAKDGSPKTLILLIKDDTLYVFDGDQEFLALLKTNIQFDNNNE